MGINPFSRDEGFSVRDLQSELNQLFDRFWHAGVSTPPLDGQDWAPRLDVIEQPQSYLVRVELPGMAASDVEVTVLGQTVSIRGAKTRPAVEPRHYLRSECRYGAFRRDIELPAGVQADRVSAVCRNGVLEIEVPKSQSARAQSVKVETRE